MASNIKVRLNASRYCPYQERHHVAAEGILHPQREFTVDTKSVEAQNQSTAKLNLEKRRNILSTFAQHFEALLRLTN